MAGRKQTATMELAIGATIIAGIIILIVMLMAWGNTTSFLGRHYRVVVNMTNVGGLKEGAPVKMGGFQIGRVATIQIRPGGTDMEIVLDIDENRILPKGSTAKVSTAGLVGDSFMEIIPGKLAGTIKRAATIADAERLESSPLPDLSELFTKVNAFGDQLTTLTTNLNDIIGDEQFRKNVKSLAVNIDAVSYQANLILQRGQNVVDHIETATQNISELTVTLKGSVTNLTERVGEVADTVKDTVDQVKHIADNAKTLVDGAEKAVANLDGGITDARRAINNSIGKPEVAANLSESIKNLRTISDGIAQRREAIGNLLDNLGTASGNLKEIVAAIDPATVRSSLNSISTALGTASGAVNTLTEVVEEIKKEPVLALSINKAADRIVKMKFDEMSKQPQFRTSDEVLKEINRWFNENMKRGYMTDPAYPYDNRPYTMNR